MLFSSIINYTKKSLRPHGLGDFSVRGVFLQPPYRPLYGFRNLLTKRHPFCIYAAYNDLLCCLTIFKTVYYRSASLRQLPDPAKYLRLPERLPLKNLSSEDYGIPPVLFRSDLLHDLLHDPLHVSRQQTIFHYTL